MASENEGQRRTETVVFWHGQFSMDGLERLETLRRQERMFFIDNLRMEGQHGDWRIVGEMFVARKREGMEAYPYA